MEAVEIKIGHPHGDLVVAAVTGDSAVLVFKTHPSQTLGAQLWTADYIRQEQLLYPDDWRERCRIRAGKEFPCEP